MPDTLRHALAVVMFLIFLAGFIVVLAISIRICARDARRRGRSPFFVSVACILFFPCGALAWLLFRPDPIDGPRMPQRFRLEDHRMQ